MPIATAQQATRTRCGRITTAVLATAALLIGCAGSPGRADMAQNGGGLGTMPEASAADRSASPYGSYLAGMYANQQRDLGVAADYMSDALAADPENPRLLHATFMLMAGEGRMAEARDLADRLLAQNPTHGPARLLTAVERLRAGDPAAAQEALSQLPGRGLSALVQPLMSAWVEVAGDDTDQALEKLKALEPMEGFGPLRQAHIALINDLAGRSDAAATAYEAAAGPEGARSLRLVWLIGNFRARQGDRAGAEQVYRDYMSRNPDSAVMEIALERLQETETPAPLVRTARQGAAEALFNMAGLLDQEGASDLALVYARMALFLRPGFEVGQILLGEVLQSQDRGEAAMEVYRGISEQSPFRYVARLRIADELQQLERDTDAIEILTAAAERHPQRYEPLYRLGNLYRGRERFAEAAEAYARAIDRVGEPQQRHWTLYYFRGIALERTDRWPEAERLFKTALELQPEQPYVMNYLAYSWVEQKENLEQAQKMLRRAVELRPEDGYIVDSLGWVYYRLGKYDKAVEYLERAVELRPADPVINDHLGDAYWRVGRKQEARFQWNRALGLEPDADEISGIEAKLENGLEPAGSNG